LPPIEGITESRTLSLNLIELAKRAVVAVSEGFEESEIETWAARLAEDVAQADD
jgi:hypothetical protein